MTGEAVSDLLLLAAVGLCIPAAVGGLYWLLRAAVRPRPSPRTGERAP